MVIWENNKWNTLYLKRRQQIDFGKESVENGEVRKSE